VLVSS